MTDLEPSDLESARLDHDAAIRQRLRQVVEDSSQADIARKTGVPQTSISR